MKADVAFMKS